MARQASPGAVSIQPRLGDTGQKQKKNLTDLIVRAEFIGPRRGFQDLRGTKTSMKAWSSRIFGLISIKSTTSLRKPLDTARKNLKPFSIALSAHLRTRVTSLLTSSAALVRRSLSLKN